MTDETFRPDPEQEEWADHLEAESRNHQWDTERGGNQL